ncbi:hypothetical protein MUG78_17165 [Gordonia alkaliphila]|uniref:hypothetical protein n=1 Tax=Gordonia alkaliphila TaxID=1053547 RepID=UPI001FF0F9A2|nr:hypothetical protein [Gordonia alkaliphila]MCK0441132.1 hypothetical protein [Gordonia alkaliphila]
MIIFEFIAKFQPYLLGMVALTAIWLIYKVFSKGTTGEQMFKDIAAIILAAIVVGAVILWIPSGVPGLQQRGGGELNNLGMIHEPAIELSAA